MQAIDRALVLLNLVLLLVEYLVFHLPATVLWPWFATIVLFALGLIFIRSEVRDARGLDKILPFGRVFYAVPLATFSADHFVFRGAISQIVPSWMPWHMFWTIFVGCSLLAASLSITTKKVVRLSSTLLGIMFTLFVVMMHIPGVVSDPHDRIAWAIAGRDLSFAGVAFAIAAAQITRRKSGESPLATLARYFIAVPAVIFGFEHFRHPDCVPAVPLQRITPDYVHARFFWAYLTGVVLIAAGGALLFNRKARLAAVVLGVTVFLVVLFVYVPILLATPASIELGLNYIMDTLMYAGAILVLAEALPRDPAPASAINP